MVDSQLEETEEPDLIKTPNLVEEENFETSRKAVFNQSEKLVFLLNYSALMLNTFIKIVNNSSVIIIIN